MKQSKKDMIGIRLAQFASTLSKDRSTKVGAAILGRNAEVLSIGYNGFPRGVNDNVEDRHERPAKYLFTEHAERNALYNALRTGISVTGCTLYLNYEPSLCSDCCRGVIQSGITEIVGIDVKFPGKGEQWEDNLKQSMKMLDEAGIIYRTVKSENLVSED